MWEEVGDPRNPEGAIPVVRLPCDISEQGNLWLHVSKWNR